MVGRAIDDVGIDSRGPGRVLGYIVINQHHQMRAAAMTRETPILSPGKPSIPAKFLPKL